MQDSGFVAQGQMVDYALGYARMGWRVFRLTASKTPFKGSRGFKDATVDEDVIRQWWTETPHANIGLATGYAGPDLPNIIVVDCDGDVGLEEFKRIFGTDGISKTLTAKTPHGWHFFFLCPPGTRMRTSIAKRKKSGDPGVDIKADKAYVVLPPSVSISGTNYIWGNWGVLPQGML